MGKLKSVKSAKDKKPPKTLSAVKSGAVLKVSKMPQSKSKDMAKKAAAILEKTEVKGKTDKKDKKSKSKKKEPTPPPVESSEADSDGSSDSDSDQSSLEDGPLVKPSVKGPKPSLAARNGDDTSDSSASSEEDSDDEKPAPTKAAWSKAAPAKGAPVSATKVDPTSSSDDDDDDDDDDSDTDSEAETKGKKAVAAVKPAVPVADLHRNGTTKGMAPVGPAPFPGAGGGPPSGSLRSCSPSRRPRSRP